MRTEKTGLGMKEIRAGYAKKTAKAVSLFVVCATLAVVGALSVTMRSALAAPQVGAMPVAPRETVQCASPHCASPGRIICDQPDGCPGGCGVRCTVAPAPPTTKSPQEVLLPALEVGESEVKFDLGEVQGLLNNDETLETELLTKDMKSYAGALADFYGLVDNLCHVASLSKDLAIAQRCSAAPKNLALKNWTSAMSYLRGIARGVEPDAKAAASYTQFIRANPGSVYLVVKGSTVVPLATRALQGAANGTVPMESALSIEFDGCEFPLSALGEPLSKICRNALPIPPLSVMQGKDSISLTRETNQQSSLFVKIRTRSAKTKTLKSVATLPVHIPHTMPLFRQPSSRGSSSSSTTTSSASSSSESSDPFSSSESSDDSSSSSSSKGKQGCFVCIYDKHDRRLAQECVHLAMEARKKGKYAITLNQYEALDKRRSLCKCEIVDVVANVHGAPGDEKEPFSEIKEILEVAPQCSKITFDNKRCSGFDSAAEAFAYAKELSHTMAKNGFGGTVTLTGHQTINTVPNFIVIAKLRSRLAQQNKDARQQMEVLTQFDRGVAESARYCSRTNTTLGFRVCAQDVKLVLDTCKSPGQVSKVSKLGTTTIVCQTKGKRANQSCNYIKLSDVKDAKDRKLFKEDGYSQDGCQDGGRTCLCEWRAPEVCSK